MSGYGACCLYSNPLFTICHGWRWWTWTRDIWCAVSNKHEYVFINIIPFIHHTLNMMVARLSNALLLFFGCLRWESIRVALNVVSFFKGFKWLDVLWTTSSSALVHTLVPFVMLTKQIKYPAFASRFNSPFHSHFWMSVSLTSWFHFSPMHFNRVDWIDECVFMCVRCRIRCSLCFVSI